MKRKHIYLLVGAVLLLVIVTPITFFYLTTRMVNPETLKVSGEPDTQREKINPDSTVTVLISGVDEFIFFRNESDAQKGSLEDVRTFLVKEEVAKNSFTVLIVPFEVAAYKNTVDILDEMQINTIMKYAIVDAKKEDIDLAKKIEINNKR